LFPTLAVATFPEAESIPIATISIALSEVFFTST